jgi:hypothetical protein
MTSWIEIGDIPPEILDKRIKDVLAGPGCRKLSLGRGAGSEPVAHPSSFPIKNMPRRIFRNGKSFDRVRIPDRDDDGPHRLRQRWGEAT